MLCLFSVRRQANFKLRHYLPFAMLDYAGSLAVHQPLTDAGSTMIDPLYAASGFGIGILVGMTGVGGGSLMTPLLILLFGIHPVSAIGTDLLFAACTKSVGAAIHAQARTINWRLAGQLALGSLPAAAGMILVFSLLGGHPDAVTRVVTPVLGVALLLTAALLIFQQRVLAAFAGLGTAMAPGRAAAWTVLSGAMLGVMVSLTSVGAGALGVTVLGVLHPRLPMARIVGTDIAHAIPLTLLAGAGYWFMGAVDVALLGSLLCGSVPGVVLGSLVATRVPVRVLRWALAAVLAVSAVRMLA